MGAFACCHKHKQIEAINMILLSIFVISNGHIPPHHIRGSGEKIKEN